MTTTNGTIKAALQCHGVPPSMALWYMLGLPSAGPVYYDLHAVAKDTLDIGYTDKTAALLDEHMRVSHGLSCLLATTHHETVSD